MFTIQRFIGGSLFIVFLFSAAMAQTRTPLDKPQEPVAPISAGPLVTATATTERVRFVSPGTVVQLRLEVYNETGQKLFDTELHGGNVLDWHLRDSAGQRLPTGSYACVLTTKSLSGRLSQRVGLVTVTDEKAALEAAGTRLTTAQQQAMSSASSQVEESTPFAILRENEAITAVTHDGQVGQITATAGALTFRTGDLFAGKDVERLRITPAGNVGIGTDKPEATLDVAGTVRATAGFRFSDGTTLDAAGGKIKLRDAAGEALPSPAAAGTGTLNQLAKWTETGGAGTLGDSALFESGGQLGVGTASPNPAAVMHADRSQNGSTALFVTNNNAGTGALASIRTALNPANFTTDYASLNILGTNWPAGMGGAILKGKTVLIEAAGSNLGIGNISASEPIQFYTTASRLERMRITSGGNVGIGTTNPLAKLDVTGNINTSTGYYIGGGQVLSVAGIDNTFAGVNAGFQNTSGLRNSFFGKAAGQLNTAGFRNSFFGESAGLSNQTADDNVFVGADAGRGTTTGDDNVFVGSSAGFNNTSGSGNVFFGTGAGGSNVTGSNNTIIGNHANVSGEGVTFGTAIGSGAVVDQNSRIVLGRSNGLDEVVVWGSLHLHNVGLGGSAPICRNGLLIAVCSSSLRYKTNLNPYIGGLDVVRRLQPISFNWKNDGMKDLGFAAEEVEKIEPLLTTRNDKGEIEGVKYAQITTVLVNAVREQQQTIEQQQQQIDALKTAVCQQNPQADVCKQK
jgi:hypothetical protein